MTSRLSSAAAAASAALLLLTLTGCAGGGPETDGVTPPPDAASAPPVVDADESGETYGCTPALLAYAQEYGYPAAVPLDPASLDIPDVSFTEAPACYLKDDQTGAERFAAFWTADPQGVLESLGAALDAAGYQQSDDYGPLIWWKDGAEPTTAEHAVGAAPQPVDGADVLYVTW